MATAASTFPIATSTFDNYLKTVDQNIQSFAQGNLVIDKINNGTFQIVDYHRLLLSLFHQVCHSSTSFAIAGAMSSNISPAIKDYLLHHAEEEKSHWAWILEDLESTGYNGPDPRSTFPNWAAQSYLSYGVYLSFFDPVGRLAMANCLEGISGRYGIEMGMKGLHKLGLKKEQAKFFLAHGELDQGHTEDIVALLKESRISPEGWASLENVVTVTTKLYRNIYNSSQE